MQIAPLTTDETQRVSLLRSLQLLDSAPEEAFDRLTRLAARLLQVPVALISLVDEDRQWFKSRVGLDTTETHRDYAFCAHALHVDGTFVVPDALADTRFADNPLVTGGPRVRAYAGMRLLSSEGHALGTLCVIDHQPREFSADELALLRDLAELARREILHRESRVRAHALSTQSQRVLADSEALYQATFEHAAIGIALVGLDGAWLRFNRKLCAILDRPAIELAVLNFQQITHPDDLATDLGLVQQLLAGDASQYTLEKRYLRPDGSEVWVNLTVTLVRDAQQQPQHFIAVVEDIDARHAAEQSLRALRVQLEQRVAERTQELQVANDYLTAAMRQRQETQAALAQREADLRAVIENAHDAYISIDATGLVIEWNRRAEQTFGWARDEALGRRLDSLIIPLAHREAHRHGMQRLAHSGEAQVLGRRIELPALRRDGSVIPCELIISELPSLARGKVYAAFLHDISERKQQQQQIADSTEELRRLYAQTERQNREQHLMLDNDLVGIAKLKNRQALWCNRAFERMFGYAPGELDGQPSRVIYRDDASYDTVGREAYPLLQAGGTYRTQLWMVRKSGEPIWVDASGTLLSEETGESMWMMVDITPMKQQQEHAERMAYHDALTGLPNRLMLHERLAQALPQCTDGRLLAVAFIDLDGFKPVNDRLGHEAGDRLLQVIAARLQDSVRGHDTVARLGGDEFVVVLTHLATHEECRNVLDRILTTIGEPVALAPGQMAQVSASIGVAYAPHDGNEVDSLLAAADQAMYRAKQAGRNQVLNA